MSNLTNSQIKQVLERYIQQKEYRRVYYGNKYKTDPKYRQYNRDYNKVRYENNKLIKLEAQGQDINILKINRAKNIYEWFKKTDRIDIFKTKYPEENMLINPQM